MATGRQSALTTSVAPLAPSERCVDWMSATGVGSITAVGTNYGGSSQTRIWIIAAVPPESYASLEPGHEYFAFRLQISHAKTVGTGACGGCTTPVCLGVEGLRLTRPSGGYREIATETAHQSSVASWQGASPSSYFVHYQGMWSYQTRDYRELECAAAVPARNHTWGSIKSLYR